MSNNNGFKQFQSSKNPETVYFYDYDNKKTKKAEIKDEDWKMMKKIYDEEKSTSPQALSDFLKQKSSIKTHTI